MEPQRLKELVENAKLGDKNALEELFTNAWGSVYRLALRILKNQEDAEDIAQEVYITIQQKISDLRDPAAFFAWANQITANKCNSFFSKHKGLIQLDDEDELSSVADDNPENMPGIALDDTATRKIIMDIIDNLPDKQRICILLFYYGQLTVADIATALETNENTIKTRLSMARAKIRAALEEKAKKDGIKLWGVAFPLALAPIVREAMDNMPVPPPSPITGAPTAPDPAMGTNLATTQTGSISAGVTAIIICCVCAVAIIAAVIFLPQAGEDYSTNGTLTAVAELPQTGAEYLPNGTSLAEAESPQYDPTDITQTEYMLVCANAVHPILENPNIPRLPFEVRYVVGGYIQDEDDEFSIRRVYAVFSNEPIVTVNTILDWNSEGNSGVVYSFPPGTLATLVVSEADWPSNRLPVSNPGLFWGAMTAPYVELTGDMALYEDWRRSMNIQLPYSRFDPDNPFGFITNVFTRNDDGWPISRDRGFLIVEVAGEGTPAP